MKYLGLLVALVVLVGCETMPDFSKGGFGFKDPEKGLDVSCKTVEGISKCSYIGPDGKEFFVEGDIAPVPAPVVPMEPK